jgi:hypothetical protein
MNGLILGIAKLFDMQGICLLGQTSGYVIDALAAKNCTLRFNANYRLEG